MLSCIALMGSQVYVIFNHPQDTYWQSPPPNRLTRMTHEAKNGQGAVLTGPNFQGFHSWSSLVRGSKCTMLIHSHSMSKAYANPALSPPSPIKPTSVLREELAGQTRATEPFAAEGKSQPRSGALQEQKTTSLMIRRSPHPVQFRYSSIPTALSHFSVCNEM